MQVRYASVRGDEVVHVMDHLDKIASVGSDLYERWQAAKSS